MVFENLADVYNASPSQGVGYNQKGTQLVYWNVKGPELKKPQWWDKATYCPPGMTIKGTPDPQDPHAGLNGWSTIVGWDHGNQYIVVHLDVYRVGKRFSDNWAVLAYLREPLCQRFFEHVGQPETLKDLLDILFRKESVRHPLADPLPPKPKKKERMTPSSISYITNL